MSSACTKKIDGYDNTLSEITKQKMLEREVVIPNMEEEKTTEEIIETIEETSEIPTTQEATKEEEINDLIDKNDINYQIHAGNIDCIDTTECMEISLPIQLKYNNLISDVTYLDILTNNHKKLGYFIKYTFKPYKYETYDECQNISEAIMEVLNNKIGTINCSENGELSIKAIYEEGEAQ